MTELNSVIINTNAVDRDEEVEVSPEFAGNSEGISEKVNDEGNYDIRYNRFKDSGETVIINTNVVERDEEVSPESARNSEGISEKANKEGNDDINYNILKDPGENVSITRRIYGISLIFTCSILATTQGAILKYLKGIPTGEAVMTTAFYALCFFAVIVNFYGTILRAFPFKKFVFMRCTLGGMGFLAKVWSFQNLPFGDATALIFTTPFFAGIIARFYLKEKYTIGHIIATVFGLAGIVLIAKPTFLFPTDTPSDAPWWYVLVPLGTAAFMGWSYVCSRIAGGSVSPITISFYLAICQLTGGVVYQTGSKAEFVNASCFEERSLLVVCGLLSVAIYLCLNKGLAIEKSATATLIRNCDTVMAYLVQIFVFKAETDLLCLIGAALIVTGTACMTLTKAFDITCGIEL